MADAYIEFQVGDPSASGWVNLFLRRCIGEPGSRFRFDFIDANDPAHAVFKLNGEGAYAFLAEELAKSVALRPPSVTVSLLESIDEEVFPLDPADIEVTWFRDPSKTDSGFVTHTDACARLVHAASGMVAQCTEHRSRARNHVDALSLLRARVFASQHLFSASGAVARKLTESDLPALQSFFDSNPDYFVAVNGAAPRSDEARREFDDRPPPGMPFDDAFIVGFHDSSGRLIAMASITTNLLAQDVWHIGLFIVATSLHGSGAAASLYDGLEAWIRSQGARWIRLGAVAGNSRAERFWERRGYVEVRRRTETQLGKATCIVRVFVKPLSAAGIDNYLHLVARDRPDSDLP